MSIRTDPDRIHRILLFVALIGLPLSACGAPDTESDEPDVDPVPAIDGYANPDILVDTEWVLSHLSDPTVHFLDVSRNADTYTNGHLPGAFFVDWARELSDPDGIVPGNILTGDQLSELMSGLGIENHHTIVFYDETSNLYAARAYWALRYYRHGDVRVYNGGSRRWTNEGHELVYDPPPVPATPSGYRAGAPDPMVAADWSYVVGRVDDPSAMFCDARSPDEHGGVDVRAERGGHIPGSVNVEWTEAVGDDGTFLPASELAELYASRGFTRDREIITYCQSGVRGAHSWFVLSELLGYPNVRVYDGSWGEYGNREDSPIDSER